jgi:glycosyltransferase involved in cell wall biosynthesis
MQDIVPIKIFEYMAVGKPVITTKLSGIIKEFGFNNGVMYVNKPEETLMAADELVKTDVLREMGMKARICVEPKDWIKITDCFEKYLEGILQAP